ncbi:hypothetical protein KM043_006472 [Ampulex compressa]|nr:hypothetical protein KM043_006472 [Ampulex compressa]
MDNINQLLNYKMPNKRTSLTFNRTLVSPNAKKSSSSHVPWSARMFSKVKKYRDVLRDALTIDKTPRGAEILTAPVYYDVLNERTAFTPPRKIPYDSSIPDIVSSIGSPVKNSAWQSIAGVNVSSLSGETRRETGSILGKTEERTNVNHALDYSLSTDSLKSFLDLERQLKDESLAARNRPSMNEEERSDEVIWSRKMANIRDQDSLDRSAENECSSQYGKDAIWSRRKISAEPYFSYARDPTDLYWLDQDDSPKTSGTSRFLDTSEELATDVSPRCSTFREDLTNEEHPSLGKLILQDSGFENNSSIIAYND